ncbi:MAG: DUF1700 domain-containing protein [Clostridiales Family XIII bacterium]|jgi:uncharacterized membrane protein|nr:DUF1700 domain-containing protein [Clostridiales Family XIII bacterium]
MTAYEYIQELKYHLRKLPDDDREDAITYYFEYLAEAGPEGEMAAMQRLGSPAQLAAGIRADAAMERLDEYAEAEEGPRVKQGVAAVWLAVLGAIPRTIGAVFAAALVLIVPMAVLIALLAAGGALMAGGAGAVVLGILLIPQEIAAALFWAGAGLVVFALGYFLWRFIRWLMKKTLRGIAGIFNNVRRRRTKGFVNIG